MVAFTFALLATSVQGSANILATTPEFTLRKLTGGATAPATTTVTAPATAPATCDEERATNRLGFLKKLQFPLPPWFLELFGRKPDSGTEWMILPSALAGAATSVVLALKLLVLPKLISNYLATTAIIATSLFSAMSPLQTALSEYCGSDKEFFDFFFKDRTTEAIATTLAVPGNIAAIVMAVMGFNHLITYGVAVAAYAATFYANLNAVRGYMCDEKNKTWGFQAVDTLGLESTLCPTSAASA